jgi:response regulator RpfG family c-di-GMP phosphodiesterase
MAATPTPASLPAAALNRQPGRETILIVEDHPGLRDDLYSLLSPYYQCLVANHAAQGLALAMTELPDLVLSDLMMEQADSGFQLLAALKGHLSTCHIPVLLLTALADEQNRLKGLLGQADAYLGKPASESAILAQVEVLLNQRWRLSEHIRAAMLQVATADTPADDSRRFQAKLQGILAHLYQDPTVQIQHIASAFGKSVSVLQKLARQHLAVSLKESLRDYRLQQAKRQLSEQPTLAIELIAEQCGFGSIRSLQRDFKQLYQITPQQYRDGHRPLTRPATTASSVSEVIE